MLDIASFVIILVALWVAWNSLEIIYHLARLVGYVLWLPIAFLAGLLDSIRLKRTSRRMNR